MFIFVKDHYFAFNAEQYEIKYNLLLKRTWSYTCACSI